MNNSNDGFDEIKNALSSVTQGDILALLQKWNIYINWNVSVLGEPKGALSKLRNGWLIVLGIYMPTDEKSFFFTRELLRLHLINKGLENYPWVPRYPEKIITDATYLFCSRHKDFLENLWNHLLERENVSEAQPPI